VSAHAVNLLSVWSDVTDYLIRIGISAVSEAGIILDLLFSL